MHDVKNFVQSLPPAEAIWLRSEADYYGASYVLASSLGKTSTPVSFSTWRHGWIPFISDQNPEFYALGNPEARNLVTSQRHVEILLRHGYSDVKAVGLPYIYLDHGSTPKLRDSLLVMPGHTHEKSSQSWNEKEFVESVHALRGRFEHVLACIHPVCAEYGYWTDSFEKAGIPWVFGAGRRDRNALYRMRDLLGAFEYVSTNTIGSHIPYAAWSGTKVFFSGNYDELKRENCSEDPFYQAHPLALDAVLSYTSEQSVRQRLPWLFVKPDEAEVQSAWAFEELGGDVKRTEEELAKLLGWTIGGKLSGYWSQGKRFLTNPNELRSFLSRAVQSRRLLGKSQKGVRYLE